MNILEKGIALVSPKWAAERAAARLALERLNNTGYNYVPPWRDSGAWAAADAPTGEGVNEISRDEARRKARDLERNSEIVNAMVEALVRNVVGKGFSLQVRTERQKWNNAVEAVWQEWCRPGNCEVSGKFGLTEILAMIVRRRFVDGGILLVKTIDTQAAIPFKLQILEVDSLYELVQQDHVIHGIEVDGYNRPVNYLIQELPLDSTMTEEKYYKIPADRVYFLAHHQRPSEVREMTPLARTIMEIRNLDEFQDAVAFKEKINAAVAVWITNSTAGQGVYGSAQAAAATAGKGNVPKRIQPGSVNELAVGQDVRTLVPSGQASEYANYNMATLRRIASGHGLSYEIVTRDVSQVTYSSARQNLLEDWKIMEMEQQYLISHFLDFVFEEVVNSAVLKGVLKAPPGFYQNKADGKSYLKHEFIGQGMPWIDPKKEADANTLLLNNHLITYKEYYAKKGKDWEEEIKQAQREKEMLLAAGLIITPDAVTVESEDNEDDEDERKPKKSA